ncbi:uncharacterized protein LOC135212895 [Macrobrachium nipponense]|uniref:uncharacterized protein LOC135212895 n=1 Tax=Macrobrachium nipponense TaxID=159736 RepID=UPI0030C851D4
MPCWQPKACCCCCGSLKTGTLVLGMLTLIVFGIDFLSVIVAAAFKYNEIISTCDEYGSKSDPDGADTDVEHICTIIIVSVFVTWGVISLAITIFSILLLVGVNKNMPGLMIPYMVGQVIAILLLGTVSFAPFVIGIINGVILGIILGLVLFTVIVGLQSYLLLVVRAHYKELRQHIQDRNRNPDSAEVMLNKI